MRRAGEGILVAYTLLRLVRLPFDDVSHGILGALAVHHLLRRVVRVVDERPRDVAEEPALWQLLDRLARLELARLVRHRVPVVGFQRHGTALLSRTAALPLDPRTVVSVDFIADAVRRADGQIFFSDLLVKKKRGQQSFR